MPEQDHPAGCPAALAQIGAELTQLEAALDTLFLPNTTAALPDDKPADRTVLHTLAAVHRQHPGAWLRPNSIASYIHDRAAYRETLRAVERLRGAGRVESIVIAFEQRRLLVVRVPVTTTINTSTMQDQINQMLARIGHEITIRPSRLVARNFTPVTVQHEGRQLEAWRHTHPYEVTVEPTKRPA